MGIAEMADENTKREINLKKRNKKKLSTEEMSEIESRINADRRKLEEQVDMEVEERDKIKVAILFSLSFLFIPQLLLLQNILLYFI